MNKKRRYLFLLFMIFLFSFIFFVPEVTSILNNEEVILGAHRGDSLTHTENTIDAINESLNNKTYNFIEFDIRYTKDKKIILHHDDSLLRNHLSFKEISELNYDEIENYTDYHIPSLEEALDLIRDKKNIIIELKSNENISKDKEFVDSTIEIIEKYNIPENKVMLSSISYEMIDYIQKNYPQYKTGTVYWLLSISYLDSEDLVKEFYMQTKSEYILLHNINLRSYDNLLKFKPTDKTLLFWNFEDKIYLVSDKKNLWE